MDKFLDKESLLVLGVKDDRAFSNNVKIGVNSKEYEWHGEGFINDIGGVICRWYTVIHSFENYDIRLRIYKVHRNIDFMFSYTTSSKMMNIREIENTEHIPFIGGIGLTKGTDFYIVIADCVHVDVRKMFIGSSSFGTDEYFTSVFSDSFVCFARQSYKELINELINRFGDELKMMPYYRDMSNRYLWDGEYLEVVRDLDKGYVSSVYKCPDVVSGLMINVKNKSETCYLNKLHEDKSIIEYRFLTNYKE